MLRTVIASSKVTEIYTVGEEVKRGMLVVKDLGAEIASKADGEGVDVYLVDADNQLYGALSDVDAPQYDESIDTVSAGSKAVLVTYAKGGQFATDQVSGNFSVGDFAVASNGLFAPAQSGQTSKFKYIGEYVDGDKVLARFEVVEPRTI